MGKGISSKIGNNNFGSAGTYKLWRSGGLDVSNRISFAQDRDYAQSYSGVHNGADAEEYEVSIKNPLVINLEATRYNDGYIQDEQAGTYTAYNRLFGTDYDYKNDPGVTDHGRFYDYAKYGSAKALKMLRQRDKEIMAEATKQGYDAVIYRFNRPETINPSTGLPYPNGRTINRNEVLLPPNKKKDVKRRRR